MTIQFKNRMKFGIDVWWEKITNINNQIIIPDINTITSSLRIPFRNRMKYNFDVLAPERKILNLSPIDDSFISENNPYMNFGNGNNMLIGYQNNEKYEGLLKFDLKEYFPVYNEENIIILDSELKLTISNTRDLKQNKLNIYEVFESGWNEMSVTWKNKPYYSNQILKSLEIKEEDFKNQDNFDIRIDVKDLVLKWLNNPNKNNGLLLDVNNNNDNIMSIFSKENYDNKLIPILSITYIDLNSSFVTANKYLHSFVYIWEQEKDSISNELEVITRHSTNLIKSELLLLQHPGDLLASLTISKDRTLCNLDLVGSHINANLQVYEKRTSSIESNIQIQGINIENKIKISSASEIFNALQLQYGKYLKGFLGINPNKLINEVNIKYLNSISNLLAIYQYSIIQNKLYSTYENSIKGNVSLKPLNYLNNKLGVSYKNTVTGEIIILPLANLKNKLKVYANKVIKGDIFYGKFVDLIGYLDIKPNSHMINNLLFMYENSIKGNISTLTVRGVLNNLRYSNINNLTNYIASSNLNYIKGFIDITSKYLLSEINIQEINNIKNSIGIQGRTIENKLHVSVQQKISAFLNLMKRTDLKNKIKIINEHITNIINIYIQETSNCKNEINTLGVNQIVNTLKNQYGDEILSKINIYIDMISVIGGYVKIINDDYKYNQKQRYGYIM